MTDRKYSEEGECQLERDCFMELLSVASAEILHSVS
jgi:hypothetical protein